MPWYLVYQYAGPGAQPGTPEVVRADDAEAAAVQFYNHAVVVPCRVFPEGEAGDECAPDARG